MNDIDGKIKKSVGIILFIFCCLMAVSRIVVHGRGGSLSAISGLMECLLWALGAGILFVWLFLGKISGSFTNFLFGGKEYLKETPMSLSHVRGYIAAGEIEEAALLIQELYGQFPDSAELNALIVEFYCDSCNNRELACEFACNYLKKAVKYSPENIEILLRYCDLSREFGIDNDDLIEFLLDQSASNIYSEPDKKRIFERIKGLTQ